MMGELSTLHGKFKTLTKQAINHARNASLLMVWPCLACQEACAARPVLLNLALLTRFLQILHSLASLSEVSLYWSQIGSGK